MVSCQEPSPLKGSKHSLQCHPHDAALVNALSFVFMGVEARCRPSKSAAHRRHMKRQPFFYNGRPHCGRCHCHHHHHLRCHRRLHRRRPCRCRYRCYRRCRRRRRRNRPSPSPLPSAIAVAVAVNHCRCHLCHVAIIHRCCLRPCCWSLPSPSPLAIAVAIAVGHHRCHVNGHFRELLPWRGKICIRPIEAKDAYFILFCSDSGRCIDGSRMTDQVLSGDGQHQHWAASSKQ
jgi:hypothetical protein